MTWAIAALGALLAVGFIYAGLVLGLATYAHVFEHFRAGFEAEFKRKIAVLEVNDKRREERARALAQRVKQSFGAMPEHEGVIEEEVERALSAGPGDR